MEKKCPAYQTIEKESRAELVIERSRFIAHSFPVKRVEEARNQIGALRLLYPDATHCCYAWRLGSDPVLEFATDAGEPRGTAGRPILGAIRHRDLTNLLIAVNRYYGGKKLGVRGLINAYGQAAQLVLESSGVVEREIQVEFLLQSSPVHFQVMVNQLIGFCRGKKGIEIHPDRGEIRFRLPLQRLEEALGYLELKQRDGIILSWKRGDE